MILLTDAGVGIGVSDAANNYKNLNNDYENRLIVVGLNTDESKNNNLRLLASSPEEFFSSTFQGLEEIAEDILEQVCSQELTPTPTQTPPPTPTPTQSVPSGPESYTFYSSYSSANADVVIGKAYYSPANNTYEEVTPESNQTLFWNMGFATVPFINATYPSPNWTKLPEGKLYTQSPIALGSLSLFKNNFFIGSYWNISFNMANYSNIDDLKGLYTFTLTNTSNNDQVVFTSIIFKAIKDGGNFIYNTIPDSRTLYSTGALTQPSDDRRYTRVNTNYNYSPGNIYKLEITSNNTGVSGINGLYWYVEPTFSPF